MEMTVARVMTAKRPMGLLMAALAGLAVGACGLGGMAASGGNDGPADDERAIAVASGATVPAAFLSADLCDTESATSALLGPGDPGALAGPALARFLIRRGLPVTAPAGAREFLNYYGLGEPPPVGEGPSLGVELGADPSGEGRFRLQVVISAAPRPPGDRPPLNLTLSVDTSAGMEGTPIQRAKQCCVALAASLREGDVISLVGWDPALGALLEAHPVSGPDDPVLVSHCNALTTGTVEGFRPALEAAFDLALAGAGAGRVNRLVLISNGGPQASIDDALLISRMAEGEAGAHIRTFAAGVGDDAEPGSHDDGLLTTAATAGGGAGLFIDSAAEAARVFGGWLPALLLPAASDPRVELALPPTLRVVPEPSAEEEVWGVGPAVPKELGFGGKVVLRRSLASCAPAAFDQDATFGLTLRYEDPAGGQTREVALATTVSDLLSTSGSALAKGRAVTAWAEALDEVGDLSGAAARERLDQARAVVREVEGWGNDPDLVEIDSLIGLYRELF